MIRQLFRQPNSMFSPLVAAALILVTGLLALYVGADPARAFENPTS